MANRRRDGIEGRKVYILKNGKLRVEIIQLHYDILVANMKGNERQQSWWHKLLVVRSDKRC